MDTVIEASAAVLGDFVSADAILPARHSFLPPAEMAANVLGDLGEQTNARVRSHAILVVGTAFGYGTGRESPARALRAAGVKAIVGKAFARMFFRNCLNNGILALECPELAEAGVRDGDTVTIRVNEARISHGGRDYACQPVAPSVLAIVAAGGLIPYGKALLAGGAP